MDRRFLSCVLSTLDGSPRFAKDWLDIAPSVEELEGNFFWVYGKELEDISWKNDKKDE